ncbi:MAG TPA: SCO family protein [Mycobacteriales bacterium]|nr:SCO family protein [Mycobacteriales bacterium]
MRLSTGVVALLAAAPLLAGCGSGSPGLARLDATQVGDLLRGGVLSPPDAEPRIVLTDTAGHRLDVRRDDGAKVTLVYFGYTHCPDICPTTMADIAEALRESTPEVRRQVQVDFVTVDPHRDRPEVLRRWLDRFDPSFVGLRGSLRQVVAAQRAAGVPVSKVERNGKAIEHSTEVLAYTPDRFAHVIYFEGPSTIDDLRHDLPILVSAVAYGSCVTTAGRSADCNDQARSVGTTDPVR